MIVKKKIRAIKNKDLTHHINMGKPFQVNKLIKNPFIETLKKYSLLDQTWGYFSLLPHSQ